MKRTLFIILFTGSTLVLLQQSFAQKANKQKKPDAAKGKTTRIVSNIPEVPVTLGNSGRAAGTISKSDFDAAMKQGLTVADGKVTGFVFSYSERAYYEDSLGNPMRVIEHFSEPCIGNNLSQSIRESIYDRTKGGDTVLIEQVKVLLNNGTEARGKTMLFPITK